MDRRLDIRDLATTEADRAEAAALQQEALENPKVRTQAQSRYERYREEAATQAAELTGVSRQDALARIPAYSAAEVERKTVRLPAAHPLQIKGEWMTAGELAARSAEFDGVSMPDPIEGPEYGKSTAKVYNNDGSPVIHSWAHGVGTSYVLTANDPSSAPGTAIVASTRSETVPASEPPRQASIWRRQSRSSPFPTERAAETSSGSWRHTRIIFICLMPISAPFDTT